MCIFTKLSRMVVQRKELPPINSLDSRNEVVLWGCVTNWIHYISTCRRPLDTKLGKVLPYHDRLTPLKMTLWLCDQREVIWQFKIFISLHLQDLWPLNLVGCWLRIRDSARKCLSRHLLIFCVCTFLVISSTDWY